VSPSPAKNKTKCTLRKRTNLVPDFATEQKSAPGGNRKAKDAVLTLQDVLRGLQSTYNPLMAVPRFSRSFQGHAGWFFKEKAISGHHVPSTPTGKPL
jgi:hypothetical protein